MTIFLFRMTRTWRNDKLPLFIALSANSMANADNINLHAVTWPASRLDQAVEGLAKAAGLLSTSKASALPDIPEAPRGEESLREWMAFVSHHMDIEAVPVESSYPDIEKMLQHAGPSVLPIISGEETGFLLLLKGGSRKLTLIATDRSFRRISLETVRAGLCRELEAPLMDSVDHLLNEAEVPEDRREKARTAILREQLNTAQIQGGWLLRISPAEGLPGQIRHARIPRQFIFLMIAHAVSQLLTLVGWWIMGRGVFQGHFELPWIGAWALVLFTSVFFQLLMGWAQSLISVDAGIICKQRLLYGILQLDPEEIRHQGAGQFLGRVMESEAVESLALGGGFIAVAAGIDFITAAAVMALAPGGGFQAFLLLCWTVLTAWICLGYFRDTREWVETYREMTNRLVERMVGHRTRLAQEDHRHWHDDEDQELDLYLELSETLDRTGIILSTVIPRGWMLVGLLTIVYPFIFAAETAAHMAVGLGGMFLAYQALSSLTNGILSIMSLMIAWDQVGPLFKAASRGKKEKPPSFIPPDVIRHRQEKGWPIVTARDLTFRYRKGGRAILENCSLQIHEGDRLLLEGPSGGGKSTLATLLSGLRAPESGVLQFRGIDQQKMGLRFWRRRMVSAPQFHENHVLTETFAFNLLMGRRWPPMPEDIAEAEAVCRELGLGDLINRMPAGFQQMVGESGWQLSHGERSRLFIARALLQGADLIILDESFAALDPENLLMAMECVLRRARTVLVIAHP